jgi:hypothetical protein
MLHVPSMQAQHRTHDHAYVKVVQNIGTSGQVGIGGTARVRSRRHGVYNRRLLSDQAPEVRTNMQTTDDDDAPNDVRVPNSRFASIFTWTTTIGGIVYMAVLATLAVVGGRQPLPMRVHNTVLAALIIGAVVSCTMILRQVATQSAHRRAADIRRLETLIRNDQAAASGELRETYEVLARRLRDYGHQIAGLRDAVAEVRGREHSVGREAVAARVAIASCAAQLAALREEVGQLAGEAADAKAAAFRRGLVAAVNPPADVVPINGRNGALNGYSGRS